MSVELHEGAPRADEAERPDARPLEFDEGHRWWRDARRRRMLAGADLLAGLLAVAISPLQLSLSVELLIAAPVVLLMAKFTGLYDLDHRKIRHLTADELSQLTAWAVGSMLSLGVIASLLTGDRVEIEPIVVAIALALALGVALRALARRIWRSTTPPELTMVIGDGELRRTIERKVEIFPDMHLELVSRPEVGTAAEFSDDGVRAQRRALAADVYREALARVAERIDRMIVAHDAIEPSVVGELVGICRAKQVKLNVVSPLSGRAQPPAMTNVAELPVMEYDTSDVSRSTALIKRGVDIVLSAAGLVVFAIPMLLIAAAIKLGDRGPVFFRQTRVGKDGKKFQMVKFRSMSADAEERLADLVEIDRLDEPMFKIEADPRVTPVGHFLRRWSLDELPQLFNVLRGDMSLVGPRPEEARVVERYRPEHLFRLDVKPGMTGPMQVYGRNALTFGERLAVELDYIENASFGRDLRILCLTLPTVARGTGRH